MRHQTRFRTTRNRIAAGAALAVGLTGLIAGIASADPLVDPTIPGSLVITKLANPPAEDRDNGMPHKPGSLPNTPVAGVTFSAYLVLNYDGADIDLTTDAGWIAATDVDITFVAAEVAANPNPGDCTTGSSVVGVVTICEPTAPVTTLINGVATFDNIPLGLYYVAETLVPPSVVPGDPYLVTLPMTNPSALSGWMMAGQSDHDNYGVTIGNYVVYTYPKNDVVGIKKDVDNSQATTVGDTIVYTITADVPCTLEDAGPPAAFEPTDFYMITDQLDQRLTFGDVSVFSYDVELDPTDYSFYFTDADNTLTVELTDAGMSKFANGCRLGFVDPQITVVIKAIVNEKLYTASADDGGDTGEIVNTALLFPDEEAWEERWPDTSNLVVSRFGGITLNKVNGITGEPLSGATFQVYSSLADALNASMVYSDPSDDPGAIWAMDINHAITAKFTTDTNGETSILDLAYDSNGGSSTCNIGYRYGTAYWVVEVQAPNGFELQPAPIEVCVVGPAHTYVCTENCTDTMGHFVDDYIVTNIPHKAGFPLPFTGEFGQTVTWFVGFGVMAGAAAFLVIRARKARLA